MRFDLDARSMLPEREILGTRFGVVLMIVLLLCLVGQARLMRASGGRRTSPKNEKPLASHEGPNDSGVARDTIADHIVPGNSRMAVAPCPMGRLPDGHRAKTLASLMMLTFTSTVNKP
jgi:hypothetical protein